MHRKKLCMHMIYAKTLVYQTRPTHIIKSLI